MGNSRNTGYLQNAIKVSDTGAITFVSGSTTLATLSTTGQLSGSLPALSASYAATASYASNLNVSGTITATTLVVQTITSSISTVTGSTQFGSLLTNTHVFSGSVTMNPGGLFVSSSGNVSIGTNAIYSNTRLTLARVSGNASIKASSDNGGNLIMDSYDPAGAVYLNNYNAGDVILANAGGKVGIGTSSPASGRKLTVAGGAQFTYTDNGGASFNIVPGTNGQDGADFNLSYYTGTGYGPLTFTLGGSERMRITSGGNVGIGVNPAAFDTIGPVLQMGRAIFYGYSNEAALGANFRYEGGDKYINSDYGCLYQMKNGTHVFSTAPSGTAGAAMTLTARMIIANSGAVTFINNGAKRATLTKYASVGASSSTTISFNVANELGVPGAGYIMVEISAIGYGGSGSNGMVYKAIAGGYSGHTINSSYHRYSEYVSIITNGSVSIYNPSYDVYGISVTNNAGSGMNFVFRLDVTWYG